MATFRLIRIEAPEWATQPDLRIYRVTVAEYAAIQRHREEMLQVVHREVEAYLNDPRLIFDGDKDGFPHRRRLTGSYYIGGEMYETHGEPVAFVISVMCRCLESPKSGMDREDDYLGLQVWLRCCPGRWSSFEVFRNTDSSSI
ncbi:MAG TPA: hypothetical protein VKS79_15260 [Gemmataceae bacterium]|nr:hypothetical protein [Gemmataceae bacterium]